MTFGPANSLHSIRGPIGVSMRFCHSWLFFGQTNNGNMWKEEFCWFVYEHTAEPGVSSLFVAAERLNKLTVKQG